MYTTFAPVFASNAGMIFSLNSFSVEPPEPPTYKVVCAEAKPADRANTAALKTDIGLRILISTV